MKKAKHKPDFGAASSLGEVLAQAAAYWAPRTALIEADRDRETGRFAYRDFRRAAEKVASFLRADGLHAGDHVAIVMSNQSKWLMNATAIFWEGCVLVPVDYKLSPAEQAQLLKHSEAKAAFIEWPIFARMRKEGVALPKGMSVIVTEAPLREELKHEQRWEELLEPTVGKAFHPKARARDDVACIVYSSGTGGTPKGCMLTHGNYLAQAAALAEMFPIKPQDRYFSILPTNHAIDFMCGFILPLYFGAAVVHQRTLRPEYLASTMKAYGVTHMSLVPMFLKAFERKVREKLSALSPFKRFAFDALKVGHRLLTARRPLPAISKHLFKRVHEGFGGRLELMFAGGAFVDSSTAEFFYSIGLPVVIGYGLTEAGTVLTVNDLRPFRADTVGRALPGTRLELRQPNAEGVGEVYVSGPTVMKGYFKEPELTAEVLADGWLRTGDLGVLEPSGHLKLVGRSKNMIVTEGGKNIYPEDVESAFENTEGLAELVVFSSNYVWPGGALTEEKLVMAARLKEGSAPADVLDGLRRRNLSLPDYKRVARVLLWAEDFPRTASMKVKRADLVERIRRDAGADRTVEL